MSRSNKSSTKRKADEPIASCMTTRSKQFKKDEQSEPQSPVTVELSKRFNKIKLNTGNKQGSTAKKRSASKDSVAKHADSAKRSVGRPKKEATPETDNEEHKSQADSDEEINVYSDKLESVTKGVRSSTRKRTKNLIYSDSYVYDDDTQRRTKSATKLNRSLASELDSVQTEKKTNKKPFTIENSPASTTTKKRSSTTKTQPKTDSTQASKKKPTKSKSVLKRIDERSESGSNSSEDSDKENKNDEPEGDGEELNVMIDIEEEELKKRKDAKKSTKKKQQAVSVKPKEVQHIDKFDAAILQLQEYTLPNEIPCRESEKEMIRSFIKEGIENKGLSHCLYISGVPGIGKTVSVLEVIKQIQKEHEDTDTEFNFIHVNGLALPNPENTYQVILKSITNINDMSNSSACVFLSRIKSFFCNNLFQKGSLPKTFKQHKNELDQRTRLVLLDELDYLITKDQNLLYNLFDWPHLKNSKLIVIGIANTMNLPEQLIPKITSRMGNRRLVYKPYTSVQIEKILLSRIEGIDIIKPEAITFLSKKIATFSSDIRRTLHVCREAFKLCREEIIQEEKDENKKTGDKKLLTMEHIRASYSAAYSSPYHQCIQMLMDNTKLLLIAICLDMKSKTSATAYLSEVQDRLKTMLSNMGRKSLHHSETKQIFNQLVSLGLATGKNKSLVKKESQTSSGRISNIVDVQITLKISQDDITNALKDDLLLSKYTDQF